MTKSTPATSLYRTIDAALPVRQLPVDRGALVRTIISDIEKWKSIRPEIAPHAEKIKRLMVINDGLLHAAEVAQRKVEKLGVAADIERVRAENMVMGIDSLSAISGRSAALDLYLVAVKAAERLRVWNRLHRRPKSRPRSFSADLSASIARLCKQVSLSNYETENLLAALSGVGGLPKLTAAAVSKRRQRTKSRGKTK